MTDIRNSSNSIFKKELINETPVNLFEQNDNIINAISDWSAYFQIDKIALNSLLRILKKNFPYLPEDFDELNNIETIETVIEDDNFPTETNDEKPDVIEKPKKKSINKPKQCPICGVFRNNIPQHLRIHTGERPFKCSYCDMRFKDEGTCDRHKRIHTGERPFACNYCEKKFKSSSNKIEHMRIHTGERPYKCQICSKRFTTQTLHNSHMFTHGKKPEYLIKHICKHCERPFQTTTAMNLHIRIIHMGEKVFACDSCEKSFTTKASQKYHEMAAHGETNRTDLIKCTECSKCCSSASSLRTHVKLAHTLEKETYSCPTCNKTFDLSSYLQKHVKRQKCK